MNHEHCKTLQSLKRTRLSPQFFLSERDLFSVGRQEECFQFRNLCYRLEPEKNEVVLVVCGSSTAVFAQWDGILIERRRF